jgi:hypothetical protein
MTGTLVQGVELDVTVAQSTRELPIVIVQTHDHVAVTSGRETVDEVDHAILEATDAEVKQHMHDGDRRSHGVGR